MSISGNDKTRIKPQSENSAPTEPNAAKTSEEVSGDKTTIARPNDKTSPSLSGADDAGEDARRRSAEKKARELEKRLAAIAKKKNGTNPGNSPRQQSASDNNTRVQPRSTSDLDDKTRLITDRSDRQIEKSEIESPRQPDDKTVFKPVDRVSSEPTAVNDILVSHPVSGGRVPVDPAQYLAAGQELLKNRFVFEKVLGAGGMGVVYKAKDLLKVEAQDRDPYVAIKVLSDEFKTHPEAFIALQRESRKTQRIAHPNIVNVHDFDRDGDTVFMTMEYLEGKPLDKLISQYKSTGLPEEDVWKILSGICAALVYAHEQRIIHSDFKPGNIFVTNSGTAKVFDFGIARAVARAEKLEESVDDKTVFDAGNLGALTPAYASLEMLEGETPDVRDDIYALGCIAYEMLTGEHPFNRIHADEAMRQKLKVKRIPGLPKRKWRAIEKALAFKREDRTASVAEFWHELNRKGGTGLLGIAASVLVFAALSGLSYQVFFAPTEERISKDAVRSEIEREFLINQNKNTITELLQSLEFSASWERRLWTSYQALADLLMEGDSWLLEHRELSYEAYIEKISSLIVEEQFERARALLVNAERYAGEGLRLQALSLQITEAEERVAQRVAEEQKRQIDAETKQRQSAQKAQALRERNAAFDVALGTVNTQLACRSTMNMRDIDIAVSKLRSLNLSRYRKVEAEIVQKLGLCISRIGRSFPERAEEFKRRAMRIFPANPNVAAIKIEPKDPCDQSLAGLGSRGSRAVCRDLLKSDGKDYGRGPSLVVIPAKGSVKSFAIGRYEVTIGEFNQFCDATKACQTLLGNPRLPVTGLEIQTINAYIAWLEKLSKRNYRLPTKSEWIYAARGRSAKLDSNRNCQLDSRGIKKGGVLVNASTGRQNDWGLINHVGNARELVRDGSGYATIGGSYTTPMRECTITNSDKHAGNADKLTGFRLFREISAK